MTYRNHVIFAITITTPLLILADKYLDILQNLNMLFAYLCLISIYALLPDIDISSSKINKYIPSYLNIFSNIKHRGFTHKPLFLLITPIIAILGINQYLGIYSLIELSIIYIILLLAITSHIIGDGMTLYGVPMFIGNYHLYTLPKKYRFASGSRDENRIIIFIYLFLIVEGLIMKEYILAKFFN